MAAGRIRKIVIVGGGIAGWIAAAALARLLPREQTRIELIEWEEAAGVGLGVGAAAVPSIHALHSLLGIEERDFLRTTHGTFKLGIEFRDWGGLDNVYAHCFGDFGAPIEGVSPHHHWLRLRALGDATPLGEYSLPYVAGRLGRFTPPDPNAHSPIASHEYAYHVDGALYARHLRAYAEARGVVRREGKVVDVYLRGMDGFVETLTLEDGERVDADFFIDASGSRGLLIEEALQAGYEDWSHWLPCNRAIAAPCERTGELTPYTIATVRADGWQWRIPLQDRIDNGYVYCSELVGDDEAEGALCAHLEGRALAEPRVLRFTNGHRKRFWSRNCLAVGLAAGVMEPLEATGIQLIQSAMERFVQLFPDMAFDPRIANEYNRVTANEYARIRDFLILHYCVTERDDTALWRYCRTMRLPEPLQYKIDVFRSCGRVPLYSDESYQEPSWVSIFLGQHAYPDRYDPIIDRIPIETLAGEMRQRRAEIRRFAEAMPAHADVLSRYRCG
jgi:tryptophan halogenase